MKPCIWLIFFLEPYKFASYALIKKNETFDCSFRFENYKLLSSYFSFMLITCFIWYLFFFVDIAHNGLMGLKWGVIVYPGKWVDKDTLWSVCLMFSLLHQFFRFSIKLTRNKYITPTYGKSGLHTKIYLWSYTFESSLTADLG